MKKLQRAFTLVELLIVIAIIGILASVILSSLNDARQQGFDAKVKSEMDAISSRAALEESQLLTYDMVCGSNGVDQTPKFIELVASINSLVELPLTCNSDTGDYAVSVPLGSAHWCVDSAGVKKEIPDALVADTEYSCP